MPQPVPDQTATAGGTGRWFEQDALWAEMGRLLGSEESRQTAAVEAQAAAALLEVEPPAHILDLCCGLGRHALPLAAAGYTVTGVDRTPAYLRQAREHDPAHRVEWLLDDMLTFRRENAFDGAINMFSSFGYYDDIADDLAVLRNLHASLRPGARLVIDLMSKELVARSFAARDWQLLSGGRYWLQEREVLPGWDRMQIRWICAGGGDTSEFTFQHRIYSAMELGSLLQGAGFVDVIPYGALDRRPYDRHAARLVMVARKPLA